MISFKFFYNSYKSIDENLRKMYLIDLMVKSDGFLYIRIGSGNFESKKIPDFSIEEIMTNKLIFNSLCKKDRDQIKGLAIAEGDLLITQYNFNKKTLSIKSMVFDDDLFEISLDKIKKSPNICNRINKRHLFKLDEYS